MSNPALNDQRENFTAKLNKKYSICTVLLAGLSLLLGGMEFTF